MQSHSEWLRGVGERLRKVRRAQYTGKNARELSQVDLVRRINQAVGNSVLTPQKWNNYETGDHEIPSYTLTAFCNVTGATRDYVIEGKTAHMDQALQDRIAKLKPRNKKPPGRPRTVARAIDTRSLQASSLPEIGKRLIKLRGVLGLNVDMAKMTRTRSEKWNEFELGVRRIGIRQAKYLCEIVGVTLDWIYRGALTGFPDELRNKLESTDRSPND